MTPSNVVLCTPVRTASGTYGGTWKASPTAELGGPVEVPAMTVNRVCGSSAQAIVSAAHEVMLGHVSCAVAGGMENMDQAPYLPDAYDTGRIKDIYLKDDDSVIARRSSVR
jgi:acetyl-CoA C-acetyltransferase